MAAGNTFEAVDELGDKQLGWVPHFPLGMKQTEYAEHQNFPFAITQGGKESLYPEYQLKIEQLRKEDAAQKAAAATGTR